jgi:hypothetical protein
LPWLPMIIVATERLEVVFYDNSLKIPPRMVTAVSRFYGINHFLFKRPAVMVKGPFTVTYVHMGARSGDIGLDEDNLEVFAIMELPKHLGQNVARSGGKEGLIFTLPEQKRILPLFGGAAKEVAWFVHGLSVAKGRASGFNAK